MGEWVKGHLVDCIRREVANVLPTMSRNEVSISTSPSLKGFPSRLLISCQAAGKMSAA